MTSIASRPFAELRAHSIALIRDLQTPEGAYPASPTFSAYQGYSWFRDGSFIADGMSAVGEQESADAFFSWCARVILAHRPTIDAAVEGERRGEPLPSSQMLPARFRYDGSLGTDDWWDFQLDGYGTWLWAFAEHCDRHDVDPAIHAEALRLTVQYLVSSWHRPCFDWWEEHDEAVHISSLGCIWAGLAAAVRMTVLSDEEERDARAAVREIEGRIRTQGVHEGHLTKWIGNVAVDASLASLIAPLGVIPPEDPIAAATVAAIEQDLAVDRGVHRFAADTFFGGGQWPLLSCFVGLAHESLGHNDEASEYREWAASTARDDLAMPEQVDWHLLDPSYQPQWIEKWGSVATPLLWSHAMLLRLDSELA